MTNIFELSPPVLFTLFLNALGYMIARTPFNRSYLPILLPIVGAISYPFVSEVGKVSYQSTYPMALNALYGFLLGSASVGVSQVFKQLHRAKATDDTALISKDNNAPEIVIPQPDKIIQLDMKNPPTLPPCIIAVLLALTSAASAASDTIIILKPDPMVTATDLNRKLENNIFRAKEFAISALAQVRTRNLDKINFGVGAGVQYFLTDRIGASGEFVAEDLNQDFDASGYLLYRYPINKVAIYGGPGAGYSFRVDDPIWGVKAGLETRLSPRWAIFGEAGYQKGFRTPGDMISRMGVRYVF